MRLCMQITVSQWLLSDTHFLLIILILTCCNSFYINNLEAFPGALYSLAYYLLYYVMKGDRMAQTIALAIWKDRISPVFDSSQVVLIVDIENGTEISRRNVTLEAHTPLSRARELSDLGVQVLICGAISLTFANAIESMGINIIPFVAGDINPVIRLFLEGTVLNSDFLMPGCRRKSRRRFRGGRNLII